MPPRTRTTEIDARKIRETFVDRPARRRTRMHWEWPKRLIEVGKCEAVMYTSDKWHRPGEFEDYKHVAEGPQTLYLRPGFLTDLDGRPLDVEGHAVSVNGPLPDTIAELAPILGIQCRLYQRKGNKLVLPGGDENLYQVNIAQAKLGAAHHPESGELFLVIYTERDGVQGMITGKRLDVLRDGIVG